MMGDPAGEGAATPECAATPERAATFPGCAQTACGATVYLDGGAFARAVEVDLPCEHALDVCEGDRVIMRITCTPDRLHELIVGRLFSEGFIASVDDLASVDFEDGGAVARVRFAVKRRETVGTMVVPTYGVSGRPFAPGEVRSRVEPIPWRVEDMFALACEFAKDTPLHVSTGGAHSCYLAQGAQVLFCCEDLGRHNALDKVIGWALLSGVELAQSLVFSSGRIPADMVGKVIRSGVPILATKAVPTELAVRMAREARLTLICQTHPDSIKVFNDLR